MLFTLTSKDGNPVFVLNYTMQKLYLSLIMFIFALAAIMIMISSVGLMIRVIMVLTVLLLMVIFGMIFFPVRKVILNTQDGLRILRTGPFFVKRTLDITDSKLLKAVRKKSRMKGNVNLDGTVKEYYLLLEYGVGGSRDSINLSSFSLMGVKNSGLFSKEELKKISDHIKIPLDFS